MDTNRDSNRDLVLNDLQEIVEQMGYGRWGPQQIHDLSRAIDQLDDSPNLSDFCDKDESVFGDLYLNYEDSSLMSSSEESLPIHSPLKIRKKSRINRDDYESSFIDDEDGDMHLIRSQCSEIADLLDSAYEGIAKSFNFLGQLENHPFPQPIAETSAASQKDANENKENVPTVDRSSTNVSKSRIENNVPRRKCSVARSDTTPFQLDPSLRSVLCPVPGRAVMKHDPVTKIQLYKEMWKRHPTPEEQRRLALRWKVREVMLKKYEPEKFPSGRVYPHPNDWSPKPYID